MMSSALESFVSILFYDSHCVFLVSRLNSDVQKIQDTLSTNISMFVRGTLFIIVVLVLLLVISPLLTGVTILGIIPLLIFAGFYSRWIRKL